MKGRNHVSLQKAHTDRIGDYNNKERKKTRCNPKFPASRFLSTFNHLTPTQKLFSALLVLSAGAALVYFISENTSGNQIASEQPLPKIGAAAVPFKKNLPGYVETINEMSCYERHATSFNHPKKCSIKRSGQSDDDFILKDYKQHSTSEAFVYFTEYQARVVSDVLKIRHAPVSIFKYEGTLYAASLFLKQFKTMKEVLHHPLQDKKVENTRKIKSLFGNKAIIEFAIASTLLEDLHINNVGFDKKGLIVIDSDMRIFGIHQKLSSMVENLAFFPFDLSINNIIAMKNRYQNILMASPATDPHNVDKSKDEFGFIVKACISACDHVINLFDGNVNRKVAQADVLTQFQSKLDSECKNAADLIVRQEGYYKKFQF